MLNIIFRTLLACGNFCVDQVDRRCAPQDEFHSILTFCHSYSCGGHFGAKRTTTRYLKVVFISLLFLRMHITFAKSCEKCQRTGNITHKNQMPLTNILLSEIFMFGLLILWVPFLLLLVIFISFLLLIMCPMD
jgi:hypothetical protein